jgi:adenosylhomocysteine nucleosidase
MDVHHGSITGAYQAGDRSVINAGEIIGRVTHHHPPRPAPAGRRADIGVIAILSVEMRAVVEVFERAHSYQTRQLDSGAQAHEADVRIAGATLRTVAIQALDPGSRSAVVAYHQLRDHCAPPIVVLAGVAGAIRADVAIGDVVIADEVIYYDARRETAAGVRRRGQGHRMAAVLRHRLNEFFRVHGELLQDRDGVPYRVHRGPIGSGDAVVTDRDSDTRRWLGEVHENTLAVETEAGGIAQAFYEEVAYDDSRRGWLAIRGISDRADRDMGQDHHDLASAHAADVLERLLPFLLLTGATG